MTATHHFLWKVAILLLFFQTQLTDSDEEAYSSFTISRAGRDETHIYALALALACSRCTSIRSCLSWASSMRFFTALPGTWTGCSSAFEDDPTIMCV
jgi:hypothetical protein